MLRGVALFPNGWPQWLWPLGARVNALQLRWWSWRHKDWFC